MKTRASEISISGFTIVRNAVKLNYPFRESVLSVLPLCDEFIINIGDSEDETAEIAEALRVEFPQKIRLIHSKWERKNQQGGFQLKHQTDRAIQSCRGNWCFYIQADEAIHEADYPRIQKAVSEAHQQTRVDGVLFDYLHFYGNYDYSIHGRNWYRREVRLFKNFRGISSFRDAQGFRRDEQRLFVKPSGARVFHYGYVRTPSSLEEKSKNMSLWWGTQPDASDSAFRLHRHVGLTRFEGTHPGVMKSKVENQPKFDPSQCPRKWDWTEIKNAMTLVWDQFFNFRLGEFRNYEIV